jgi:hypothetical protein
VSKRQKSTQSNKNKPERTHPRASDPIPQGNQAVVLVYLECKGPPDPSINLRIYQLSRELAVGAAGPWIPPHCHLSPLQWLDTVADEGTKGVCAHQPISEQNLEEVIHRLQLMGIFLSHIIPPAGLDGSALTHNCRDRCIGIIPLEEKLFPPSNR